MSLLPDNFVQGKSVYFDGYLSSETNSRIYTGVSFNHQPATKAMIDTGAPFCILDPEEGINIQNSLSPIETIPLQHQLIPNLRGSLYRVPITFEAVEGSGLTIEGTVLIPEVQLGAIWHYPNLIGLTGCLERIRFAVDPAENFFYFGSI